MHNISIYWKSVVSSFDLVGRWLSWEVGNGSSVILGEDPWVGSVYSHILLEHMVIHLWERGYINLSNILDHIASLVMGQGWLQESILAFGENIVGCGKDMSQIY